MQAGKSPVQTTSTHGRTGCIILLSNCAAGQRPAKIGWTAQQLLHHPI